MNTLVLGGGGKKGIAHLGVLRVACDEGFLSLSQLTEYVGCSIGGYICACLACNIDIHDITVDMFCHPFFTASSLYSSLKIGDGPVLGVLDSSALSRYIVDMFTRHGIDTDITMSEVQKKFNKVLKLAVTNITHGRAEYISPDTHPDKKVIRAVEMSCCIPGLFRPILEDDCLYVDGGVLDNFPLRAATNKNIFGVSLEEVVYVDPEDKVANIVRLTQLPIYKIQQLVTDTEMVKNPNIVVLKVVFTQQIPTTFRVETRDIDIYLHGCRYMLNFLDRTSHVGYYESVDDSYAKWL